MTTTSRVEPDIALAGNRVSPKPVQIASGAGRTQQKDSGAEVVSENRIRAKTVIGFTEIKEKYLPHRYPLLMLDRITDYRRGEYIEAIKCVTGNSPELVGHFPERAIMPATFIIQALAQLAIVFIQLSNPLKEDEMTVVSTASFRFLRPVFPGDTLQLTIKPGRLEGAVGIFQGNARVENRSVVRGSLTLAKTKISRFENPPW